MANKLSPDQEKRLWRGAMVINKLSDTANLGVYSILTPTLVAAATGVSNLIALAYAALVNGTTELFGPEARKLVEVFEQTIRDMESLGLIDDTITAALTTVNTASAATDLRYLIAGELSDTTLDVTKDSDPFMDGNWSASVTG
jgi:hypothetical protein